MISEYLRLPLISTKEAIGLISRYIRSNILKNPNVILNYPEADVIKFLSYLKDLNMESNLIDPVPDMLNTVLYFPDRDPYYNSPLPNYITTFLEYDVYKRTGLDLITFLQLPVQTVDTLLDMLTVDAERRNVTTDKVKSEMLDKDGLSGYDLS